MVIEQGAVLVLAGGRSRRMGTDKARLPVAGTTLLNWQCQRLTELDLKVLHSGPDGIPDAWPDFRGPLAGIHSALTQYPDLAFWLVVPVDMPALPLERLRRLVSTVRAESVPVAFNHAPLPIGLPATTAIRETLAQWLNQPDGPRSLRALMSHFNGRWLAESLSEREGHNLNTPDDWSLFQSGPGVQSNFSRKLAGDPGEPL